MKHIKSIFIAALFSLSATPAFAQTLLLKSDSFWLTQTSGYPTALIPAIEQSIADMPAALRAPAADNTARAAQLKWAFKIINDVATSQTDLDIAPGTYDFTTLYDRHFSVDPNSFDALYLPKLYIGRSNVTVHARDENNMPVLTYNGVGSDQVNHGRVLLLLPSGLTNVKIQSLRFVGDHTESSTLAYYAHENNSAIKSVQGNHSAPYAMLMVGRNGGPNDVQVYYCTFEKINFEGIRVVGNISVDRSVFEGVIPQPTIGVDYYNWIITLDANVRGYVGEDAVMAFNAGIYQSYVYGPLTIHNSSFNYLMEGAVISGAGDGSQLTANSFYQIGDHGFYILTSPMKGSLISNNAFEKIFGSALKLASSTTSSSLPFTPNQDMSLISVLTNTFKDIWGSSIEMGGTFNTVKGNVITPVTAANYTPPSNNVHPDIWLSHRTGNATFWNHIAYNLFENNNTGGGRQVTIFLSHYDDATAQDRSLAFNKFIGSTQKVYIHAKQSSLYAPIELGDSPMQYNLTGLNCLDCQPSASGYFSAVTMDYAKVVRVNSSDWYLLKFQNDTDIFLVGRNGEHRRIHDSGQVYSILDIGDVNNDGNDEVYTTRSGGADIYGSVVYTYSTSTLFTLGQWYFSQPWSAVSEHSLVYSGTSGAQLLTRYTGSSVIYGSQFRPGTAIPVIGAHWAESGAMPAGKPIVSLSAVDFGNQTSSIWTALRP